MDPRGSEHWVSTIGRQVASVLTLLIKPSTAVLSSLAVMFSEKSSANRLLTDEARSVLLAIGSITDLGVKAPDEMLVSLLAT